MDKKKEFKEEDRRNIQKGLNDLNEFARFFQYDVLNSWDKDLLYKKINEDDNGLNQLNKLQTAIDIIADATGEDFYKKR